MKFKYIDYTDDLCELDNSKNQLNTLYVFNNNNTLRQAKRNYESPFLQKRSSFITLNEFKERILPTDKIVLKEEKAFILFYESLTKKDKKDLNIGGYYDSIDIAGYFFSFFRELNEYNIKKLNNLEKWQEDRYIVFNKIKKRFIKKLEEKGYTHSLIKRDLEEIDLTYLRDFSTIELVNTITLTPFEKDILTELNKKIPITVKLQMPKEDFDEDKLKIKKVSILDKIKTDIEIFETTDSFLEKINLVNILEKKEENVDIMMPDPDNIYAKILNKNKIKFNSKIVFEETKIYRFLNNIYNILFSVEILEKSFVVKLSAFSEAIYSKEIQKYFGIDSIDIMKIQNLIKNDYRYIDEETIIRIYDSDKDGLLKLFRLIKLIYSYRNLNDYINFLENINLEKLNDMEFVSVISKYNEALSEIKVIEDLDIVSSWDKYFSRSSHSEGLFRMVLKYLRFKDIKVINQDNDVIEVDSIVDSGEIPRNEVYFLNITEKSYPTSSTSNFLLTENQRSDLGLKTYEEDRLQQKYALYRNIFSSKKAKIFYLRSEANNLEPSSFLEEIKLNLNCKITDLKIDQGDYKEIIKKIFYQKNYPKISFNNEKMKIEREDFETELNIGQYDFVTLESCYYKFFLQKIRRFENDYKEIKYKLDKKLLGIILHEIFEKIGNMNRDSFFNREFDISREKIKAVLDETLKKMKLKIPKNFEKYYNEIIFPFVIESVDYFFANLKYKIYKENITEINMEKSGKKNIISKDYDINITGRIDLEIKTDKSNYLIDYKSGSGYLRQLDFYSIMFYGDQNAAKKYIYNILDEKFQSKRKRYVDKELTPEILKETLQDFTDSKIYKKNPAECQRCDFKKVCRGGEYEESN
ncbi:MAG: PD-(D/E)XK nuclease family protein [Fusobacteriota bacterium]